MIDIGANLAHESFAGDLFAVLDRAWAAGLQAIVLTGSCAASNARVAELAATRPERLHATAGLHPHYAEQWTPALAAQLQRLAALPQVVALGECGLDYFRDLSPRPAQRAAFIAQLDLAVATGKPVFLHQRDAHADFLAILRDYRPRLAGAVVHCFTDTGEALDDYLALDCHIGITGWICDERRGGGLIDIVGRIPDARLMIETDAPYLLPRNVPREISRPMGRRNEPAMLPWVCEAVAAARGQTAAAVASATTETARCFFGI